MTLMGKTSFSCSCVDSAVRPPGELMLVVLTFSADPVLRNTSTGRTGAAVAGAGAWPRKDGTDDGPLRSFSTGAALSTGCELWPEAVALTGLKPSGPRRPPTVVLIGAMLPLIVVRMLISFLVLVVDAGLIGGGTRPLATPIAAVDENVLLDAALDVLLALLAPLAEDVPEPDGASGLPFFVSKINGTILFSGGGLTFSWLSNGIVNHAMAFLFFSDMDDGESVVLLLADDVPSCDADDGERRDDGPGRFRSSHTENPQSWGSAFSIRCRFSRSSSSVNDGAGKSSKSIRCFPFPLLFFPSSLTFFATSSPESIRIEPSTTASVIGSGHGDSLPVDVLARGFVLVPTLPDSSLSTKGDAGMTEAFGGSGGEGWSDPLLSTVAGLGGVSDGTTNSRRAGDRSGVKDEPASADIGTSGGGIISLSLSRIAPMLRLLTVRSSSTGSSSTSIIPASVSSIINRLAVLRSSVDGVPASARGFKGEECSIPECRRPGVNVCRTDNDDPLAWRFALDGQRRAEGEVGPTAGRTVLELDASCDDDDRGRWAILVDPVREPVDDREPLESKDDTLDGVVRDDDAEDDAWDDAGRV
jgi:hypothetical protein